MWPSIYILEQFITIIIDLDSLFDFFSTNSYANSNEKMVVGAFAENISHKNKDGSQVFFLINGGCS